MLGFSKLSSISANSLNCMTFLLPTEPNIGYSYYNYYTTNN